MEGEWIDRKKQAAFKEQQTKSPDPNNTQWRNDTSAFGFQMLLKMGWKEGNGLGRNQQGDPTVLKTLKQFDTTGLGVEKNKPSANNWLETKASFDELLKRLNSEALPAEEPVVEEDQKKKRKRREEKDSSEKSSEKKKKRKTESPEQTSPPTPTPTQDAQKILKSSRVLYPKRAASKMISLYSEHDMNQILGHGAKLVSKPSEEIKSSTEESSNSEEEEQKEDRKEKKKKDKKEKKEKKEKKDKKDKKKKRRKDNKKDAN